MDMNTGQAIKEARIRKKMTQAQLAQSLGLATITIRQYENGTREPKLEILRKIASVLDISVYSLVSFEEASLLLEEGVKEKFLAYGKTWEQFDRIQEAFSKLNQRGAERAADAVEDIAKIPEYQEE